MSNFLSCQLIMFSSLLLFNLNNIYKSFLLKLIIFLYTDFRYIAVITYIHLGFILMMFISLLLLVVQFAVLDGGVFNSYS